MKSPKNNRNDQIPTRRAWFVNGRLYFSRETERRFFFIMTIGMAVLGLLIRLDWIS